jgi:hypothetical protein
MKAWTLVTLIALGGCAQLFPDPWAWQNLPPSTPSMTFEEALRNVKATAPHPKVLSQAERDAFVAKYMKGANVDVGDGQPRRYDAR